MIHRIHTSKRRPRSKLQIRIRSTARGWVIRKCAACSKNSDTSRKSAGILICHLVGFLLDNFILLNNNTTTICNYTTVNNATKLVAGNKIINKTSTLDRPEGRCFVSSSDMFRIFSNTRLVRLFSTEGAPTLADKSHKLKPKNANKIPADINEYFTNIDQKDILEKFPAKLLRKKYKFPNAYYIANREAAKTIAEYLTKPAYKLKVVLESNPGPGLLTEYLVSSEAGSMHLFESNDSFDMILKEAYAHQKKRVNIHRGDLVDMWKISFQDKLDNGSRVQDLLLGVPLKSWSDIPMRLFAAVGSLNFFKFLIYSIARQSDIFHHGRFEMFLVVPPPLYIHLCCNSQAGYIIYRANTILFQIMFEHKYLTKIPAKSFLPWRYEQKSRKLLKLKKFYETDSDYLYLIKVTPRASIYDLCPLEFMPSLLYFVKQCYVSRKQRIIPTIEKWTPGCGPRLIVNTEIAEPAKLLDKRHIEIPPFTVPCSTMSNKDFYPNMNIFTEFGDLTPSQILTLFTQFRQWPEFNESPFLASMESSLLKMETSDQEQETIDALDIQEDDSVESSNQHNKLNNRDSEKRS